MAWRDKLNPTIKSHLEKQIAESIKNKVVYEEAKNPGLAQLWVAVANLSKEIFDLNLKLKYLENNLKELTGEKPEEKKKVAKKKAESEKK